MITILLLLAQEVEVHEWGTFTTVAGSDGASLEWRPLAGEDDLPSFVYRSGGPRGLRHGPACRACRHFDCGCGTQCAPRNGQCGCKSCMIATVRMETPVLYFYADRETTLSVKVGFPKGRVTEWYPQAREVGSGIDWGGVRVMPGTRAKFPLEGGASHYYPARETDAAPVRVCGREGEQFEKFLFYRGAGTFDLPVRASGEGVRTRIRSGEELSWVVLFERGKNSMGWRVLRKVRDVATDPAEKCGTLDQLADELVRLLVGDGLFEREARAMVRTWRDSWFEEGRRVFYSVPRRITDELLPLEIEPKPARLVRVLVGRAEILTPGMEEEIAGLVRRLGAPAIEVRDEAHARLRKFGRFAEPLLRRVLAKSEDPEIRARIRKLLGE